MCFTQTECNIQSFHFRYTAVPPEQRVKRILENLYNMNKAFQTDPYAKDFGISVSGKMTQIDGRILEPPFLGYKLGKFERKCLV